jgi:hypothetical protein
LNWKRRKSALLILLVASLLAVSETAARPQSTEQAAGQSKTDSNATKTNTIPKKSGTAAQTSAAPASSSGNSAPTASPAAAQQTTPANSGRMVWVNTASGVYHKPGSRYYGKTKQGKYMTEADAKKAGYHAATKE